MRTPPWFQVLVGLWLILGLPALLIGAMWSGGFDIVADPPPYFQASYEDRSVLANLVWVAAVTLIYLPLFLLPALAIWRWRKRKD